MRWEDEKVIALCVNWTINFIRATDERIPCRRINWIRTQNHFMGPSVCFAWKVVAKIGAEVN